MVSRAILSDIHGNLEALTAVLADVARQGVDEVVCLGDVVGYGPNPCECLDVAMDFDLCVLGNHDQGVLYEPEGFSSSAERALTWTRDQFKSSATDSDLAIRRWDFLCELPRNLRIQDVTFVHGSPRNPLHEYLFPEDIYNSAKVEKLFSVVPRYCFLGHTHVPGVFTHGGRYLCPEEIEGRFALEADKAIINVGSVGQPRDEDCRASYVIQDNQQIRFCRVEYPVEKTLEKIYAIHELDNFLGDRLREGR